MKSTELQTSTETPYDDELGLGAMLDFAKKNWLVLVLATIVGGLTGLVASLVPERIYRADTVLIAADDFGTSPSAGTDAMAGLGGVAALVGISMPASHQSEALAILKSRALIEGYVSEQHLLPILFPNAWDPAKQEWRSSDPRKIPTLGRAYSLFSGRILKVAEDKKEGLVTVSVEWNDPILAEQWTRDLVARTNTLLRTRAIERGNHNIAYLNDQLDKTSVVELRSAIYKLIETEIKKLMIAQGSDDYAFRYVDPPVRPERPVFPKRNNFLLLGGFMGFLLGAIGVRLRNRPHAAAKRTR